MNYSRLFTGKIIFFNLLGKQILKHFSELNITPSCCNYLVSFNYFVTDKWCISSCLFFSLFHGVFEGEIFFVCFVLFLMNFLAKYISGILVTTATSSELLTRCYQCWFGLYNLSKTSFWRVSFLINIMYFFTTYLCVSFKFLEIHI